MKIEAAKIGDVYVDSLQFSMGGTPEIAKDWKADGVKGFIGYLGSMNATRLGYILDAGLKFQAVTFAGAYKNGALDEIAQLKALGIPLGCHVCLDLEGTSAANTGAESIAGRPAALNALSSLITTWGQDIYRAGWGAELYVGVPQPFTSEELWAFPFDRYWHGQGSVRDRYGKLAEPFKSYGACRGWNMIQAAPSQMLGGLLVDYNMVYGDYKAETPMVVTA